MAYILDIVQLLIFFGVIMVLWLRGIVILFLGNAAGYLEAKLQCLQLIFI